MHRGMPYPVARAATNVILRSLSTALVMEEMYRGTPVIYVDYTDYDEIAHHSGPERTETLDALDGVDRAIAHAREGRRRRAAAVPVRAPVDHGQSLGATFLQRYGKTLGDVVRDLMGGGATVQDGRAAGSRSGARRTPSCSERTHAKARVRATVARTALRPPASRSGRRSSELGAERRASRRRRRTGAPTERPDLSRRSPSGNLGARVLPAAAGPGHARGDRRDSPASSGSCRPPRDRPRARPLRAPRGRRRRERGHALSRRGSAGGRRPADRVRRPGRGRTATARRDGPLRRPRAHQPPRPDDRRGRGVRGAHRLARRARRTADGAVHPPSQ